MKTKLSKLLSVGLLLAGAQFSLHAQLPNAWRIDDNSTASGSTLFYDYQLNPTQISAATNSAGGFRFLVNARFVATRGGPKSMVMVYGLGTNRYLIWFGLDGQNNLTVELEGYGGPFAVTSGGTGSNQYHTHEIVYDGAATNASYYLDGELLVTNWQSSPSAWDAGKISWGAGSSGGQGTMNFNRAAFWITNELVAEYDAGTETNPPPDLNPSSQLWNYTPGAVLLVLSPILPDTALLPVAMTLPATEFTADSALLNGLVNPSGAPTTAWFEWGTDTNYGNATVVQDVGAAGTNGSVQALLAGLVAGPNYHYRLVASNAFSVATGADDLFNLNFIQTPIAGLPEFSAGSLAWGDYDNDGRLDLFLAGNSGTPPYFVSQLWRNTGSGFTNVTDSIAPGLSGVRFSSVAWGDYDNDGRLDFLITGWTNNSGADVISQLWRNTGSGFTNVTASVAPGLPGVTYSSVAWGDYDNDGRLDFLLTGYNYYDASPHHISQLWRNTSSGFTNVTATVAPGLPGVAWSSVAWGDYDNDARLDFLLTGSTYDGNFDYISQLWRNTGSGFTNVPVAGLPGVQYSSVAWGDYDNDGRLDFLLTGSTYDGSYHYFSQLWRNTSGGFTNVTAMVAPDLPGVGESSVAWGDYDNDGRLDFLLTGLYNDGSYHLVSQLWRNNTPATNDAPAVPAALNSVLSNGQTELRWNSATDAQTPATGLNYNLRVGTTPGGEDVVSPHASGNGFRFLPQLGNSQMRTNAVLSLTPGNYYWSVQAADTAFAGGPFAPEASFFVPGPTLSIVASNLSVIISWQPDYPGFLLQETPELLPADWTNSPSLSTNPVLVPATEVTKFYRLVRTPPE